MDDKQIEAYQMAIEQAENNATGERVRNMQQEIMMQKMEPSMVKDQLDLGEELERIDYLLRGYSLETKDGETTWTKPENTDMIILSDYGVHLIRNTIAWYLNKNTLLSNYDEDTIRHKMEDFASDLNDTIFMEYEKVFQYPSPEDCQKILDERISNKVKLKLYTLKTMGKNSGEKEEKEIRQEVLSEMEMTMEKELERIKQQVIKNKLKRFMIIIREIQDAVHSTYNRAYQGQERRSLRQHMHISETTGGFTVPPQQGGGFLDKFRSRR